MNHPEELLSASPKPISSLLPIGVALSLLIFVATYFTYCSRHQSHAPGSYLPLTVGISTFFALMCWLNYLVSPSASVPVRLVKAGGIALAESTVFLLLLLFLLLNTVGS